MRMIRILICVALSVGMSMAVALAAAGGTRIVETVPLGAGTCSLTITNDDVALCEGEAITVHAILTCGPGQGNVLAPQWYLDQQLVGTGDSITIAPAAGSYVLTATCASCEDQIAVTVSSGVDCEATPQLDAAYAVDALESTTGVFLEPSAESVTPQTFGYMRYRMRPFVLEANQALTTGEFTLSAVGSNLAVYRPDGTQVSLPAVFAVDDLPESLLLLATDHGDAQLVATNTTDGAPEVQDVIVVRAGPFPGLAGGELGGYPWFECVATVNDDDVVQAALDPSRYAERAGLSYRAYVVAHRTPEEWAADDGLIDVTGTFESATVVPGSIADNVLDVWTAGLDAGELVGAGYDVVFDFGLDGRLDPGDLIDGLSDVEAGVHVVHDLTDAGPLPTASTQYSGGSFLGQRTYYPADIASMGALPLVIISHGNGHQYTWYDYLGTHLASYGYLVMSHQNNTQPGIESASTTTLTNTDYLIGNQDIIAGGLFDGHIDASRITWIGHSRGGEGVVRAYDRIFDGTYVPSHFDVNDIALISSIAPTVYLGTVTTNPHEVTYHMLYGAADGDVNGGCHIGHRQSLRIAEAAQGDVQVTYVHGASHNDFNCCGFPDGIGPARIGRAEAQRVARAYYLALIEYHIRDNVATRDYLTRMFDSLHPSGIAPQVVCANTYRDALATPRFVIDDYQTNTSTGIASSGGSVSFDVASLNEGRLDDGNLDFTWSFLDPMNGMTRTDLNDIYQGGVVFDWPSGGTRFYEIEILPGNRDFRSHTHLSFRACQGTRHPETVALDGGLDFSVTLRDGAGVTSSIGFGVYGSLTRPYQRTGLGSGAGWANEFNTVRIRLADFQNDGSNIDLGDVVAVRFDFGDSHGSARGRVGIDDVELIHE